CAIQPNDSYTKTVLENEPKCISLIKHVIREK
ncbi:unnamed protein product, partial [Onchocerca ochengi]|uniref:Chemokine (C-C motif) ligand 14 n=1 Tax=Onchocerca ochengi TaxID=42157 RepID=A0A182F0L1_ONCOC